MKSSLVIASAFPLLLVAAQGGPGLDQLQGTWQAVSIVENGKKAPPEEVKGSRMIVKGSQFTFEGTESYRGTLKVDPGKKPGWMDAFFVDKDNKESGKAVGIYELKGDQLKIAWRHKGDERPKDFNSEADSSVRSIVLKREK